MKHTFLKGSQFPLGGNSSAAVELPSDTELEVIGVDSTDHLAEALAAAGPKMFGDHAAALAHDEVAIRDGKEYDVTVTYGAGGARIDTAKDTEPRAVVVETAPAVAPVPAPVAEPPDELSEGFPGYAALVAAGITKRSDLAGKTIEALEEIKGIDAATAQAIYAEVSLPLTDDEIKARDEADAKAHAEALEAEKQAEADRQKSLSAA